MKHKEAPFPWHYYLNTVRSRIFYVVVSVALTFAIVTYDQESPFLKVLALVFFLIITAIVHGYFRINPFRGIMERVEKIQLQLPHDKKLKILYQRNEWILLDQMLLLTEHYIEQQRKLLEDKNRESNLLIESIPNAIVIIDKYENCLLHNELFTKKFIQDKDAKVSEKEKLWRIFEGNMLNLFRDCLHKNQQVKVSSYYFPHLGEYFDIAITPIMDRKQSLSGALGIFHNVTQAKLTEKMRVDFVANVSHEIRTPLTSIKGYTQLLEAHKESIPTQFLPILEKIDNNAERLKDLFDNLLKLSVIESRYELSKEFVNFEELVSTIWANLKAKHLGKNIKLNNSFESDEILCDPKLMEQVMVNLLDNAIKYGKENVIIDISGRNSDKQSQIIVKDNGLGIKPEDLSRIFERFYRSQGVTQKAIEGSGLGLSIVKHIIGKHRGQIEVQSIQGEGTSFTITLPL